VPPREPVVPEAPVARDAAVPVTEEGIPRREWDVGTGEQTADVTGRTVWKADKTGKAEMVEHVPGKRSVWQIISDATGGQSGAVAGELLGAPQIAGAMRKIGKKLKWNSDGSMTIRTYAMLSKAIKDKKIDMDKKQLDTIYREGNKIAAETPVQTSIDDLAQAKQVSKKEPLWHTTTDFYKPDFKFTSVPMKAIEGTHIGSQKAAVNRGAAMWPKWLGGENLQITGKLWKKLNLTDAQRDFVLAELDRVREGFRDYSDVWASLSQKYPGLNDHITQVLEKQTPSLLRKNGLGIYRLKNPQFKKIVKGADVLDFSTQHGRSRFLDFIEKERESLGISETEIADLRQLTNPENSSNFYQDIQNTLGDRLDAVSYKAAEGDIAYVVTRPKQLRIAADLLGRFRNEGGAITISRKTPRKKILRDTTPEQRENVRKLAEQGEKDPGGLQEFLTKNGFTPKEVKEFLQVHEALKVDRPMRGAPTPVEPVKGDFNFLGLEPGEVRENIEAKSMRKPAIGDKTNKRFWELPKMESGWLTSAFKNPEYFFQRYQGIRPLLDQARGIEAAIVKEKSIAADHVKEIRSRYNKKKLREEVGVAWFNLNEFGREAMQKMNKTAPESPAYAELKAELQPLFEDLFTRVNDVRKSLGKRAVPFQEDYLAFFAKESFLQDVKGLVSRRPSASLMHQLVLDPVEVVQGRHSGPVVDATTFNHLKRRGLEEGVKLDLDPLSIYARYLDQALDHIHWSPLNNFIKEVTKAKMTLPDGKKVTFEHYNPGVALELQSWSNALAGMPNVQLPRGFERTLTKASSNLTAAVLGGNLRTMLVQTGALLPTVTEFGVRGTTQAIADFAMRKAAPIEQSKVLATRVMDPAINDMSRAIAGTRLERAGAKGRELGLWGAKALDYMAAEVAWRAAWRQLEPRVKSGKLSKTEAVRRADSAVVRTQSSGSKVDLAPVQRNALGKAMFLWQTYTINQANWIGRNVLGIKNPKANPGRTAKRVLYGMLGIAAINTVAEDFLGIQSPYPAPVKTLMRGLKAKDPGSAVALKMMLEMGEIVPGLGSVKYGSSPLGGLAEHVRDLSSALSGNDVLMRDLLPKAIDGDKKALITVGELVGKTMGVTGTGQTAKTARGLLRGETLPRAAIGHMPGVSGGQYTRGIGASRGKRPGRGGRKGR